MKHANALVPGQHAGTEKIIKRLREKEAVGLRKANKEARKARRARGF